MLLGALWPSHDQRGFRSSQAWPDPAVSLQHRTSTPSPTAKLWGHQGASKPCPVACHSLKSGTGNQDLAGVGGDCREPPACPSSLSRHPWCAQNLQLLQIVFGTTVPAVKQSLHWIKKWPYLALSPHRSQELKQCLDGSSARVASVQALFPLSPPCPTTHLPQGSTACSHISGSSHCHSGFPKKRTSGLVLFFPGEEYF